MTKPFVQQVPLNIDDRGSVYCVLDDIGCCISGGSTKAIKRTYVVHNWEKGCVRAWHGHEKAWTGMHVIHGAAKLVALRIGSLENDGPHHALPNTKSVVLSDRNPGIFWIPPGYYNGSISLEDNTKILVYSTLSFDEVKNDDIRHELLHNHYLEFFKVKNR